VPIVTIILAWLLSAGNDAAQHSGGIPFAFVNHQIVLTVSVDGHDSLNFLLDSGTDNSAIDRITARRLGLAAAESGGFAMTKLVIGNLQVDSLYATAVDLSSVSRSLRRPLHGVLGHNFLADRIVQIDYPNRVVRFLTAPPIIEKTGRNVMLPMRYLSGRFIPLLDNVYVNDTPIRATLDTGSSMSLLLFPQIIAELGLEKEVRRGKKATALVYGGDIAVRRGSPVRVRIEASVFDSVPVYFATDGQTDSDPAVRGGNLGNEFFQTTRLTLDYSHMQVVIER
jgi:hypothetical protein